MYPTKEDEVILQKMHKLDQEIMALTKQLTDKYRDKYAQINVGWRKKERGAKVRITGGHFQFGRFLFLCMAVNKKDEIINGDAWTREYRPFSHIDLLPTTQQPKEQKQ